MGKVIYLEEELPDGGSIVIECSIPRYMTMRERGASNEEIYNEIAFAHDTPTMQEMIDEHLTPQRMRHFAEVACRASRRFGHARSH